MNAKLITPVYLILTQLLLIFSSCEKEIPYGYPTCDTCDWNVLICKIDDLPWQAKTDCPFLGNCDPVDCQYYPESGFIEFSGNDFSNSLGVGIHKRSINENLINLNEASFFSNTELGNCKKLSIDTSAFSRFFIIKLDSVLKIIEGKFEFQAQNDCNKKVIISDGYFKLTYRP